MDLCTHFIGDSFEHNNAVFEEYQDICRIEGGVDHLWSVGTDTRQLSLLDSGWQSSASMREMLNDDVQRRYYILDGDIEVIIYEFLQNDCHSTLARILYKKGRRFLI